MRIRKGRSRCTGFGLHSALTRISTGSEDASAAGADELVLTRPASPDTGAVRRAGRRIFPSFRHIDAAAFGVFPDKAKSQYHFQR